MEWMLTLLSELKQCQLSVAIDETFYSSLQTFCWPWLTMSSPTVTDCAINAASFLPYHQQMLTIRGNTVNISSEGSHSVGREARAQGFRMGVKTALVD